jgi:hypothetical protein
MAQQQGFVKTVRFSGEAGDEGGGSSEAAGAGAGAAGAAGAAAEELLRDSRRAPADLLSVPKCRSFPPDSFPCRYKFTVFTSPEEYNEYVDMLDAKQDEMERRAADSSVDRFGVDRSTRHGVHVYPALQCDSSPESASRSRVSRYVYDRAQLRAESSTYKQLHRQLAGQAWKRFAGPVSVCRMGAGAGAGAFIRVLLQSSKKAGRRASLHHNYLVQIPMSDMGGRCLLDYPPELLSSDLDHFMSQLPEMHKALMALGSFRNLMTVDDTFIQDISAYDKVLKFNNVERVVEMTEQNLPDLYSNSTRNFSVFTHPGLFIQSFTEGKGPISRGRFADLVSYFIRTKMMSFVSDHGLMLGIEEVYSDKVADLLSDIVLQDADRSFAWFNGLLSPPSPPSVEFQSIMVVLNQMYALNVCFFLFVLKSMGESKDQVLRLQSASFPEEYGFLSNYLRFKPVAMET